MALKRSRQLVSPAMLLSLGIEAHASYVTRILESIDGEVAASGFGLDASTAE